MRARPDGRRAKEPDPRVRHQAALSDQDELDLYTKAQRSTGCSHAPHQVAADWADRYKGKFDKGWDELREQTFARQKELGVIPADAELTPRDEAFPAWDDMPDNLKPFYARQMEVYAGYSENADHNVGRVIDAIEELGELENEGPVP